MKLITWNCNGGFRNKYNLLPDNFDILIVQECEEPNKSTKEYKVTLLLALTISDANSELKFT